MKEKVKKLFVKEKILIAIYEMSLKQTNPLKYEDVYIRAFQIGLNEFGEKSERFAEHALSVHPDFVKIRRGYFDLSENDKGQK